MKIPWRREYHALRAKAVGVASAVCSNPRATTRGLPCECKQNADGKNAEERNKRSGRHIEVL